MTRSRLRQLERIAKRSITPAELKPINVPKTFLDVNYGEEEDDEDYNPGTDATIVGFSIELILRFLVLIQANDKDDGESESSSYDSEDEEDDTGEVVEVQAEKFVINGEEANKAKVGNDTIGEFVLDNGTEFLTEVFSLKFKDFKMN